MASYPDSSTAEMVEALCAVMCQVADPNKVLAAILREAVVRTNADRGLFAEVLDDGAMHYRVMHGFQASRFKGEAEAFSRTLFRRVVETGDYVLLRSAADDEYWNSIPSVRSLQTAAILCMPIRVGDRVAAVLHLEHSRRGHFRAAHLAPIRSLLTVAAPVMKTMQVGQQVLRERDALQHTTDSLREETRESRAFLARDWSLGRFVGRSEPVRRLESDIRQACATDEVVLLLGETGTGKDILAHAIHSSGARREQPFVTVYCPSLEKGRAEAELFGHRKGAFTDAGTDRPGKVHTAEGGTLFLDEIGDLTPEVQSKLLRFVQFQTFERLGDPREEKANVRIIAATNRDLEREAERGTFRPDLFARLNVLPIRVPSLRERREDIPLLLRHCLDQKEAGRWIELPPEVLEFLQQLDYLWPHNVRHLEALAARLAAVGCPGPVTVQEVERKLFAGSSSFRPGPADRPAAVPTDQETGLSAHMDEAERSYLADFVECHPELTRAEQAARLGISQATLFAKLRRYGIGK